MFPVILHFTKSAIRKNNFKCALFEHENMIDYEKENKEKPLYDWDNILNLLLLIITLFCILNFLNNAYILHM